MYFMIFFFASESSRAKKKRVHIEIKQDCPRLSGELKLGIGTRGCILSFSLNIEIFHNTHFIR